MWRSFDHDGDDENEHEDDDDDDDKHLDDYDYHHQLSFLATLVALHFTPVSKWVSERVIVSDSEA